MDVLQYTFFAALFVAAILYSRRRQRLLKSGAIPQVEITIRVPTRVYRLAQNRPLVFVISALTGVSITFFPLFVMLLGGSWESLGDWRVLSCLLATYLVPMFYINLAAPVLRYAQENQGDER